MTGSDLQYGESFRVDPGVLLYAPGDPLGDRPIFCIVAGLVRLEFELSADSHLPVYLLPDSIFGVVETLLDCPRLTRAYCMEKSILYRWDREGFDIASSISWEVAMHTITGMTQVLRILNAEIGDRLSGSEPKG
jgi:CRP-like cAMP-binding protein